MNRFLVFAVLMILAAPAAAQDDLPVVNPANVDALTPEPVATIAVAKPADPMGDLQRRVELATKMHEFRPAREQVDNAITAISMKLPADKREAFKIGMRNALNYKALEKISIDAMAETFSEKELEVMVDYYSKPEARAISDKYPDYQAKVSPEIVKMLDKAMMQVKTGAPGQ